MHDFNKQTDTISFMSGNNIIKDSYVFIPKTWKNIVPETNVYKAEKYLVPMNFYFENYESHSIVFSLWVGNFPDQEERYKFIEA